MMLKNNLEWTTGSSTGYKNDEYPKEFEQLDENTYIQRKDIKISGYQSEDLSIKNYSYQYRYISKSLFNEYMNQLNSPSQDKILNNQQLNDSNMLIIMAAIADLYETVAVLSGLMRDE